VEKIAYTTPKQAKKNNANPNCRRPSCSLVAAAKPPHPHKERNEVSIPTSHRFVVMEILNKQKTFFSPKQKEP
jgi:hypothetical protein